jgi:prolipoprotein diacylglyceryltransferase
VAQTVPPKQVNAWLNAGLLVLALALVGARLSYVWTNWSYFAAHPIEIPQFWLGGLTWPGAVAGLIPALVTLLVQYRALRSRPGGDEHLPSGWLGDRLYPLLPPLAITAWIGSWQVGSAYGSQLPPGTWWGVPSLDESGAASLRFPLQPLAALTLLAFFWLLETRVKPLHPAGKLSGLALGGFLLHLLIFSLLRADPSPTWCGLRVDAWFAILYLAIFVTLLAVNGLLARAGRKQTLSHPERSSS